MSEEEDRNESQPLVKTTASDDATSSDQTLDLENNINNSNEEEPPRVSEVELASAQKKFGRSIIFNDEVGKDGAIHRVRILCVSFLSDLCVILTFYDFSLSLFFFFSLFCMSIFMEKVVYFFRLHPSVPI